MDRTALPRRDCGVAKDLERRLALHEAGEAAKYTRGRGPITLVAHVRPMLRGEALRLERAVKRAWRTRKVDRLQLGATGSPRGS